MELDVKRFLPKTLFGRSLLILVIPVLLIQIVTGVVFFDRHWSKISSRLSDAVAGETAFIIDSWRNAPDNKGEFLNNLNAKTIERLDMEVFVESRDRWQSFQNTSRAPDGFWERIIHHILSESLDEQIEEPFLLEVNFEDKFLNIFVDMGDEMLRIHFPRNRVFSSSGYIFILWLIGVSFLLLIVAIIFMRNQIRPIRRLAVAAERFGRGQDVLSFKPQGALEVRRAGDEFLKMSKRITRQVNQRTEMLAGISHDLRTPLTRMKLQLAMLPESEDILAMKEDVEQMEKMVAGYIDFVKGQGDETPERTGLNGFINGILQPYIKDGKDISFAESEDVSCWIRPVAFNRCLKNIFDNAFVFASKVQVELKRENDKAYIFIHDNGPGIEEGQHEDVFKPFYRVEKSRNTKTGGIGLGLSIVRDIVHRHGGKIELGQSEKLGGLRVEIKLPQ